MMATCMSALQQVSWSSALHGMDDGLTTMLYEKTESEEESSSIFDIANSCWALFRLQQALSSSGITIAKPIAYTLIGANVVSQARDLFCSYYPKQQTIRQRQGYTNAHYRQREIPSTDEDQDIEAEAPTTSKQLTERAKQVMEKIKPLWEVFFNACDIACENTGNILWLGHICDGLIQLGSNRTYAIAKLATLDAMFWLGVFQKADNDDDDFLDNQPLLKATLQNAQFLRPFTLLHTKIYTIYQNISNSNYMTALQTISTSVRACNFRNLLAVKLDYAKAADLASKAYQTMLLYRVF